MLRSASFVAHNDRIPLLAWFVLTLFLLVGVAYSLIISPFETPDELFHYGFVRHLAQGNSLPVQSTHSTGAWEQEGSQAPLFYAVAALLSSSVDQSDVTTMSVRNPYANIGSPLLPGNKNFMLYSARTYSLSGANLALHLARWFSLFCGVVTLYFTFLTARLCFPQNATLATVTLFATAAIPQFAFIAASCSNDMLVTAACTVVIYQLALLGHENDAQQKNGRWLVLGISLGLAALTKLQALGVIGLSGLLLLFLAFKDRNWKQLIVRSLLVGVPLLAIAGWWYWRNYLLYGDLFGTGNLTALNGLRSTPLTWPAFLDEFRGVRYSFWGLFGWFSIPLPGWFYNVTDLFTLLGFAGLVPLGLYASAQRRPGDSTIDVEPAHKHAGLTWSLILLLLWIVVSFALLLYWMSQAMGGQGRLIFPAVGAMVTVLVAGIDAWLKWLPGRWRLVGNLILPVLLWAMSLYSLIFLLPSSYHPAGAVDTPPADAQPVAFRYTDPQQPDLALHLQAIHLPIKRIKANESIPITLYWQSETLPKQDYPIFIQLLDETGKEVANLTTHPGWGRNPTSLWQPSVLYPDKYTLTIQGHIDSRSPLLARLYTGFVLPGSEGNLPLSSFDAAGNEITPIADSVVIAPIEPASMADLVDGKAIGATFGNVLQLEGASWATLSAQNGTRALTVTLLWHALGPLATDYTAFVHLLDANGVQVSGVDHPPAGERFPTHYWQKDDTILDSYALTLPADAQSKVEIWIGLYESDSGGTVRLPVTDSANQPSGDGVVMIGTLDAGQ